MITSEFQRLYFERLEMDVPVNPKPDGNTLRKLHVRHVLTIPYENTDYLTDDIKPADFDTQFREIILNRRGGMCIDMNPLFGALLSSLGYEVTCLPTTRCQCGENDLNFHIVLTVKDCDRITWWCDVANPFTRFFEPVPVEPPKELRSHDSPFRVERTDSGHLLLLEMKKGEWRDFLLVNDANISPEARTQKKNNDRFLCPENAVFSKEVFSINTPCGRRTLTGNLYRESENGIFYSYECPDEMMVWAYAQFGLKKEI